MKNLLLTFFALVLSISHHAQQMYANLSGNNISCSTTSTGDLFNQFGSSSIAGFEAPAGSGLHSIYAVNLWVAGVTSSQEVVLAAETYQSGEDWFPGPLTNDGTAGTTQAIQDQYNFVWFANRADVLQHVFYFECVQNGTVDANFPDGYVIPNWMLTWPAHGNMNDGLDFYMSPFYDYDSDGLYDPANGDYPLICGDQCLYFIFNDNGIVQGGGGNKTGGTALGIQVMAMLYSFNDPNSGMLDNTVFIHYEILNQSTQTFTDTYLGVWADFDIGTSTDDFVGTNVQRGAVYAYNGDSFDEASSGSSGYGMNTPITAFQVLSGPRVDPDNEDNPLPDNVYSAETNSYGRYGWGYGDGIADNEMLGLASSMYYNSGSNPISGDPSIAVEYYNYLRGRWLDGQSVYYGGNGVLGTLGVTDTECDYFFPDASDPLFESTNGIEVDPWNETTSGNVAGDRRMIAGIGPFTFQPGAQQTLDGAFTFVQNENGPATLDELDDRLKEIKLFYNESLVNCVSQSVVVGQQELSELPTFNMFPNPATDHLQIIFPSAKSGFEWSIRDMSGRLILGGNSTSNLLELDLVELASGAYVVQLLSDTHAFSDVLIMK